MHVTRVSATVSYLRDGARIVFISEALLDQEQLMLLVESLMILADGRLNLRRQRHARVPLRSLGAEQVAINLILDNVTDLLRLGEHVNVLVEEGVLLRVVRLTVSN